MINLIKEETITQNVTTQIVYKEAKIDLEFINDSNEKNYGNGLFKTKSKSDIKQIYYNKYNCIEGGVSELNVRIITEGLVAKNDWYIEYRGSGTYYDPYKNFISRFKQDNGPFIMRSKLIGINKEDKDGIPFITEEQISKLVIILNNLKKDEKPPTLAIPMKLVTINGKLSSETIIANEDGSFPFLTMKEYTTAKKIAESVEE